MLRDLRSEATVPLVDSSHASLDRVAEDILDVSKLAAPDHNPTIRDVIHILLAEDNIINQKLLQRQLVKAGFAVVVANNGLEALEYISTTAISSVGSLPLDCILMGESELIDKFLRMPL